MSTDSETSPESETQQSPPPQSDAPRLTAIELENFQSIRKRARIEIGRLTLLCGPNSAGKSALIDALELVRSWAGRGKQAADPGRHISEDGGEQSVIRVELDASIHDEMPFEDEVRREHKGKDYFDIAHWMSQPRQKPGIDWNGYAMGPISLVLTFNSKGICALCVEIANEPVIKLGSGKAVPLSPYLTVASTLHWFEYFRSLAYYDYEYVWRRQLYSELGDGILLKTDHPITQMMLEGYRPSSEHEKLFIDDREAFTCIRGYDFEDGAIFRSPNLAEIFDFADTHTLTDVQIREWLSGFDELSPEQKEPDAFHAFWSRQEVRQGLSVASREGVRIARRVNLTIRSLLDMAARACDPIHVPSDRTRIDSGSPYYSGRHTIDEHYYPYEEHDYPDEDEEYSYEPQINFDYYDIGKEEPPTDRALDRPGIYQWPKDQTLRSFIDRCRFNMLPAAVIIDDDYVSMAFGTYMPSLGNYLPIADIYRLQPFGSHAPDKFTGSRGGDTIAFIRLTDKKRGRSVSFDEVGSGLSYVLPVIAAMNTSRLRIIEQPELHLHPKAQAELCDAMIAAPVAPTIIETHSDTLVARLARRVRESSERSLMSGENIVGFPGPMNLDISSDEVRIYFFERSDAGGTIVHPIELDREGAWNNRISPNFLMDEPVFERLVRLRNAANPDDCRSVWPWVDGLPTEEFREGFKEFWFSRETWLRDAALVQANRLVEGLFEHFIVRDFVNNSSDGDLTTCADKRDQGATLLEGRIRLKHRKTIAPGQICSLLTPGAKFPCSVRDKFREFWTEKSGFLPAETADLVSQMSRLNNIRTDSAHFTGRQRSSENLDNLFSLLVAGNAPGLLLQRWYPRVMDLGGPRIS